MKIDYKDIWKKINDDSATNPNLRIARKLPQYGCFPMFLATDFSQNQRFLYILLDDSSPVSPNSLPTFRGLDISIETTTLGSYKDGRFLLFAQAVPRTENIFESVIAEICERVSELTDKSKLSDTLQNVLAEWKLFFDKSSDEILSEAAQKGLFGELSFLTEYVIPRHPALDAINAWSGPEGANHDYQLPNGIAVEVKTTAARQHRKFTVSSEKQLDDTGLNALYLLLYTVHTHLNQPDLTLPALISTITDSLRAHTVALLRFELKLARYGYNIEHAHRYMLGFSRADLNILRITSGFPRLLRTDLPEAVGDLTYTVALAGCRDFELTENEFQTDL